MRTVSMPASCRRSASLGRFGFTAMPWSVTKISMCSPGVTVVSTSFTTVGMRPRTKGATIMASRAWAAVSLWPPDAPRMMPSEPVITFTLNLVSISSALNTTTSSRSTEAPLEPKLAYWLALTSMWLGLRASEAAAALSKLCTSINLSIKPFSCKSTMLAVMPPSANEARIFWRRILSSKKRATASEAPPEPVCSEKPWLK